MTVLHLAKENVDMVVKDRVMEDVKDRVLEDVKVLVHIIVELHPICQDKYN